MSLTERFPIVAYIKDRGKVDYPHLRAFMAEWNVSYNKLCRCIYMKEDVTLENRATGQQSVMRIELPANGWECVMQVKHEKAREVKRYQIRQL